MNHTGVVLLDGNYKCELTMTSGNNDGSLQRVPAEGGRVHDFTWRVTFGTLLGLFSVGLIVSFALLLISPNQEAPGGGTIGKSVKGEDAGSDSVTSVGSDGDVVAVNDGATMENSGIRESAVSLAVTDEEVTDIDVFDNDGSDRLVARPGRIAPTRNPVGTSTNKFIAPRLDETERVFLGVKVKGEIALVCDGVWQRILAGLSFCGIRSWPDGVPLAAVFQCGECGDSLGVGQIPATASAFQAGGACLAA